MAARLARLHHLAPHPASLLRIASGWGIFLLGALWLLAHGVARVQTITLPVGVLPALQDSGLAALATALGAVPILFVRTLRPRTQAGLLGAGAGVMLAASVFSLLVPAWQEMRHLYAAPAALPFLVLAVLVGGGLMHALDKVLPHAHQIETAGGQARRASVTLFVLALALHNLPEGAAVGIAAQAGESARGVALGIALQNLPEGLLIAAMLHLAGMRRAAAVALAALSGLVEPAAAVLAALAAHWLSNALPLALAVAAGAMFFAAGHELLPQARAQDRAASVRGLFAGFFLMAALAQMFG